MTEFLYEKLSKQLKQKILSGEWQIGFKLPGELELTKEYGVGRSTVREQYLSLIYGKIHHLHFFCFMHVFRVCLKVRNRRLLSMVQDVCRHFAILFFRIFQEDLHCVQCCVPLIPSGYLKK